MVIFIGNYIQMTELDWESVDGTTSSDLVVGSAWAPSQISTQLWLPSSTLPCQAGVPTDLAGTPKVLSCTRE